MKSKFLTGFAVAATTITGALIHAPSASAFNWSSSWSQPKIYSKEQVGFNDAPYQKYVQSERVAIPNSGQFLLDPAKLKLKFDHNVTVSFINEGAGFRNQLAFSSAGTTNTSGLIFNDISCTGKDCVGDWGGSALKLGDTVKLGKIKGGSQLDFGLRADGFRGGTNIFGTQVDKNPDRLQHVVAYAIGTRHILLGFEDLFGELGATGGKNQNSDRDFNDVVFVVDVGENNLKILKGEKVPEPSIVLSLIGLGATGLVARRRQSDTAE
ncbi:MULTISPECIES: PEP-CTERM sorting domain-containing protein [unclassified Leptolyngbya]|uniref:PEP-CTERM sorting domain-containing protein n=1 Tax=unclassified Leptolyngbya TaxID=2650499 RepID=UPI003D312DD8